MTRPAWATGSYRHLGGRYRPACDSSSSGGRLGFSVRCGTCGKGVRERTWEGAGVDLHYALLLWLLLLLQIVSHAYYC